MGGVQFSKDSSMVSQEDNYKVLLVDDSDVVLDVLQTHLGGLSCTLIPATSPSEAIHVLTNMEIAVLICDLDLNQPELTGHDVMVRARGHNREIVTIMLSGIADQDAMIRAVNEGGIWKYFTKPWDKEELVESVSQGLQRYAKLRNTEDQFKSLARNVTANIGSGPHVRRRKKIRVVKRTSTKRTSRKRPKARLQVRSEDVLANRYRLLEPVGEGGTGVVYKAEDTLLGMSVAVKILFANLTCDESALFTLKDEARIAMQLSHKHIVRLHNLQRTGDHYFLVMEYVDGQTWRDILDLYGKLPLESVIKVVSVCSDALSYAHRHGVIHKDLKPENMLLTHDGILKIIDFGIACIANKQKKTNRIEGTPTYMSPEQIRGEIVDVRTDVYTFGLIVYELIAGQSVFPYNVNPDDIVEIGQTELLDLPEGIRPIVEKAIAPDPEDRWASIPVFAGEFIDKCGKLLGSESLV